MVDLTGNVSWDRLSRKRVCFGHQSVGANLIDGLEAISGGRLSIAEGQDPEIFRRPVFAHFRVGQNRDPLSKCRDFSAVITGGAGERVDAAFFKFCYVDITAQTDICDLFRAYQSVMDSLGKAYPAVAFVHVTVPLRRVGGGFLGWMREKSGVFDREREGQARRHAYNQLLREAYGASGRLFDLAEEEATLQDGKPSIFQYRGETVQNLAADYTDDGGHLNPPAAERIASRLLACLSSVE